MQCIPGRGLTNRLIEISTGDDEAVAVQLEGSSQPLGVRIGADQDKQGGGSEDPAGRGGPGRPGSSIPTIRWQSS